MSRGYVQQIQSTRGNKNLDRKPVFCNNYILQNLSKLPPKGQTDIEHFITSFYA